MTDINPDVPSEPIPSGPPSPPPPPLPSFITFHGTHQQPFDTSPEIPPRFYSQSVKAAVYRYLTRLHQFQAAKAAAAVAAQSQHGQHAPKTARRARRLCQLYEQARRYADRDGLRLPVPPEVPEYHHHYQQQQQQQQQVFFDDLGLEGGDDGEEDDEVDLALQMDIDMNELEANEEARRLACYPPGSYNSGGGERIADDDVDGIEGRMMAWLVADEKFEFIREQCDELRTLIPERFLFRDKGVSVTLNTLYGAIGYIKYLQRRMRNCIEIDGNGDNNNNNINTVRDDPSLVAKDVIENYKEFLDKRLSDSVSLVMDQSLTRFRQARLELMVLTPKCFYDFPQTEKSRTLIAAKFYLEYLRKWCDESNGEQTAPGVIGGPPAAPATYYWG